MYYVACEGNYCNAQALWSCLCLVAKPFLCVKERNQQVVLLSRKTVSGGLAVVKVSRGRNQRAKCERAEFRVRALNL